MSDDTTDGDIGDEITEGRGYDHTYEGWAELFDGEPEWASRYDEFAEYVLSRDCDPEDGLSHKLRELIVIAFSADGGHIDICRNHVRKAHEHGATEAEIHQTIQLAAFEGSNAAMLVGAEAISDVAFD